MIIRLFVLAVIIGFLGPAQAQVLERAILNVPASACTPDADTIRFNRHVTTNSSVQHAPGNVDKITLICPITSMPSTDFNGISNWVVLLTYLDSNGANAMAQVRAQLFRMDIGGETPALLATANSNAETEMVRNIVPKNFTHTFDFENFSYWVRIELDRTATSQTVIAHSVAVGAFISPSDIRLKHDVALLGRLDNGLGFYRFAYNGSDKAWVGVMAQEVQAVMPDAVVWGEDGYLRVAYFMLGFRMQPYEEWLAAGGRLPGAR